jgi:hypothetical protein
MQNLFSLTLTLQDDNGHDILTETREATYQQGGERLVRGCRETRGAELAKLYPGARQFVTYRGPAANELCHW